jgi:hypothetical protein
VYTWKAFYKDGTSLQEIDDNGKDIGTGAIDYNNVEEIHVIPLKSGLPAHKIKIHPPDERLIAFARRVIMLGEDSVSHTIWVMGWQRTDNGKNTKTMLFIYPDGSVKLTSEDE